LTEAAFGKFGISCQGKNDWLAKQKFIWKYTSLSGCSHYFIYKGYTRSEKYIRLNLTIGNDKQQVESIY
jgi:hypothetical protein